MANAVGKISRYSQLQPRDVYTEAVSISYEQPKLNRPSNNKYIQQQWCSDMWHPNRDLPKPPPTMASHPPTPQRHTHPVPQPGVYAPAITFFDPSTDTLHLPAQSLYYTYLSHTPLTGLVILGTNAEPFLLSRPERKLLLLTARRSVPPHYPLIAGVGGHSTSQVLSYISDAHDAGADYVLLLPCAYFGKQTTAAVIKRFYAQIASQSPSSHLDLQFPRRLQRAGSRFRHHRRDRGRARQYRGRETHLRLRGQDRAAGGRVPTVALRGVWGTGGFLAGRVGGGWERVHCCVRECVSAGCCEGV